MTTTVQRESSENSFVRVIKSMQICFRYRKNNVPKIWILWKHEISGICRKAQIILPN